MNSRVFTYAGVALIIGAMIFIAFASLDTIKQFLTDSYGSVKARLTLVDDGPTA
jgi:hypothetical protein